MAKKKLPKLTICQNCETPSSGNFCPECGQDSRDHRVSLRLLMVGLWSELFTFDSRFFRSFIPLLFLPGKLTVEYIGGKRVRYIPPVRLYVFVSIIFFFLVSAKISTHHRQEAAEEGRTLSGPTSGLVAIDSLGTTTANVDSLRAIVRSALPDAEELKEIEELEGMMPPGVDLDFEVIVEKALAGGMSLAALDSLAAAGVTEIEVPRGTPPGYSKTSLFGREFYLSNDYMISAILGLAPKGMFLFLPIFAAMLALIYMRSRRMFIEHLVFSLHYHSLIFIIFAIALMSPWLGIWLFVIPGFQIYLYFAMKRVYGQGWRKTWLKHFLLTGAYNIVFVIFLSATIIGSIFLMLGAEKYPRLLGWMLG